MKKIIAYLAAVKEEMGKVTWSSKDELVQATTLVVSFALVLSLIVYSLDLVIGFVVGKVL